MAHLGPNSDPFESNFGPSWSPYGFKMGDIAGPIRNPQNARSMRHAENVHFYCYFQGFLPTVGLSWAQLRRTKLRMLSPTCAQTCPSCAMLDPSWAQVGPKLEPTGPSSGPSWAQVSSCLARLKAKDGQVCPSRLLVGLCPILWVRAVLVAKRLEYAGV